MPVPENVTAAPRAKPVPLIVTKRRDAPRDRMLGLREVTVTDASVTVRPPLRVTVAPPGLVTVTLRAPTAAVAATVTLTVSWVALSTTTDPAVTPVPETATVAPALNPLPLIVRAALVVPWASELGLIAVTARAGAAT